MNTKTNTVRLSKAGYVALLVAHCAGMIDLVALPLWVGGLIGTYGFDPQMAGGIVTLFLAGVVAASIVVAPRFHRLSARPLATAGFAIAGAMFMMCGWTASPLLIAALHFGAGLSVGLSLSLTHGSIGRTDDPHKLFGVAFAAMGTFGLPVLGGTLVKYEGFAGLGIAALAIDLLALVVLFGLGRSALSMPSGESAASVVTSSSPTVNES